MPELYDWVCDQVFSNPTIAPAKKAIALLKLVDAIEEPILFGTNAISEQIDWQIFLKVFFDQAVVIEKSWTPDKPASSLADCSKQETLLWQLNAHAGKGSTAFPELLERVASSLTNFETDRDGRYKFKLTAKGMFEALDPGFLNRLREEGIHWRVLKSVREQIQTKGLKYACTHNAKDFHSSASGASSVLCSQTTPHPYIGFHSSPRTIYSGCGNGADSFYQGITSLSLWFDGRIRTFLEYFTDDTLRAAMLAASDEPEFVEDMRNYITENIGNYAPNTIDPLFKQVYWVGDRHNVLITPLISSSLQVDIHKYISLSDDERAIKGRKPEETRRRMSLSKAVKRIGSKPSNAGKIAIKLRGNHNLIKSFPTERCPDIYPRYYALIEDGLFLGHFDKRLITSLYKISASNYTNANMRETAEEKAVALATQLIVNFREIVEFTRSKGLNWNTGKLKSNVTSEWLLHAAFHELKPSHSTDIAEFMLNQITHEHLNNEVRAHIRPHLVRILEETFN
jgi:hypothetical protein